MAAKRIYQIAKEFEREEKEIIGFLTAQGIKVGNRLSAISEDAYNMLKAKYTAPPEPEPVPEPEPPKPEPQPQAKSVEQQPQAAAQPQAAGKKKKKKNKQPQPVAPQFEYTSNADDAQDETDDTVSEFKPVKPHQIEVSDAADQAILYAAMQAGNEFIAKYTDGLTKAQRKVLKAHISPKMDTWELLRDFTYDNPDRSPAQYWTGVARLMTMAFRLSNEFGLNYREKLALLRNTVLPLQNDYEPREIFTDAENELFAAQQKMLFVAFGSGMGPINDSIFDLKLHAERMKKKFEHVNLLEYVTTSAETLRTTRVPFQEIVDATCTALRGMARRLYFFNDNKELVTASIENFFAWVDGYAKLKEQGADTAKLEKYLFLEKKLIDLIEFMAMDNLVYVGKKKPAPFKKVLEELNIYRDNMDDPDAERNFKYKIRGVTMVLYKPKEYIFLCRFADLDPHKDYRPPEVIAAAEAKAAEEAAKAAAEKENPAAGDEA